MVLILKSVQYALEVNPADQLGMEKFIVMINPKDRKQFLSKSGSYLKFTMWPGIRFDHEHKIHIRWRNRFKHRGQIDVQYLPRSVVYLNVGENHLTSIGDFRKLPSDLTYLHAGENKLSGFLDLSHLPPTLVEFDVRECKFYGPIDFTHLPESLTFFNVASNYLSGKID